MLDRLRLVINGENLLVESFVHTLEHRVVISVLGAYWEVFLNT